MAKSMEEVEISKENILPIRQGRRADCLLSALQNSEDIEEKRNYFENELRTYSGNDPLSVYMRYIEWVEQSYLKGGRESCLKDLLKKCLFYVKDMEQYRNDPRFLAVWLKLAYISPEPLEVFKYMSTNNFCCKLAQFYISWAGELEKIQNIVAANMTLQNGMKAGAEPSESLELAIRGFDMRFARSLTEKRENDDPISLDPEVEQRAAFNRLKPQGPQHTAPFLRVGDFVEEQSEQPLIVRQVFAKQPGQRGLSVRGAERVKIYSSGNEPSSATPENALPSSYIFHPQVNQENIKMSSTWKSAKVKKRAIPSTSSVKEPEFTVYCDDNADSSPSVSPKKLAEGFCALSILKGNPSSPTLSLHEPQNPNCKLMYDELRVCCGAQEFSFEEIRAAEWHCQQKREKATELKD